MKKWIYILVKQTKKNKKKMDIKINFEPYSDIDSDSQCEENQEEEIYYQDNQFEFPFFQLNHTQHVADADDDDDYLDDMDSGSVRAYFSI
jgi:hypothetical protein